MKTCGKCNQSKELSRFNKGARYADGLQPWCYECRKGYQSLWYKNNKEKHNERSVVWAKENQDKVKKYNKKWKDSNKDKTSAQYKKWRERNLEYDCARAAKRKANKLKATPAWANDEKIKEFYESRPSGYDVDHIVPLKSKIVCGLHCEQNLQYLPSSENQSKRNFWWPDMP